MSDDVKAALAEYLRRVEVAVEEIDLHRASQTDPDDASEGVSLPSFGGDALGNKNRSDTRTFFQCFIHNPFQINRFCAPVTSVRSDYHFGIAIIDTG